MVAGETSANGAADNKSSSAFPAGDKSPSASPKFLCNLAGNRALTSAQAKKLTHLILALSVPDAEGNLSPLTSAHKQALKAGKSANSALKVLIAIGGAGFNASSFTSLTANSGIRTEFITKIITFLTNNELDGADIDWEFPTADDKAIYVAFLRELKMALPPGTLLSIASAASAFYLDPGFDLPGIADAVDFINVMSYEYYGGWSQSTGPFAALYTGGSADPSDQLNCNWTINYHLSKIDNPEKLNLGVPFYGKFWTNVSEPLNGDGLWRLGTFGNALAWQDLSKSFNLTETIYQTTAKTPYIYDALSRIFLTFDNPQSLIEKTSYATLNGLGGIMIWSVDQDDDQSSLLNAISLANSSVSTSTFLPPSSTPSTYNNPIIVSVQLININANNVCTVNLRFIGITYKIVCYLKFRLVLPSSAILGNYWNMYPVNGTNNEFTLPEDLRIYRGQSFEAALTVLTPTECPYFMRTTLPRAVCCDQSTNASRFGSLAAITQWNSPTKSTRRFVNFTLCYKSALFGGNERLSWKVAGRFRFDKMFSGQSKECGQNAKKIQIFISNSTVMLKRKEPLNFGQQFFEQLKFGPFLNDFAGLWLLGVDIFPQFKLLEQAGCKFNMVKQRHAKCVSFDIKNAHQLTGGNALIAGGHQIDIGIMPWTVHISLDVFNKTTNRLKTRVCTGSLIAPEFVLTAAHCFINITDGTRIKLALNSNSSTIAQNSKGFILAFNRQSNSNVFVHHKFNAKTIIGRFDLALIKLNVTIRHQPIYPICIHCGPAENFRRGSAIIAGWGQTHPNKNASKELVGRFAQLTDCKGAYNQSIKICTEGHTALKGDSGGPLLASNGTNFVLIGAVSGVMGHEGQSAAASFAAIRQYSRLDGPWIQSITGTKCN
uniref:Chitinase n=1 Tax=Globodera rostochiensis TaxID=31243 RepID=A0A914HM58_GLORO